jgi:GMP synthase PP-ATPase subunit
VFRTNAAIADQLTCVFVDPGLLRLGEAEEGVRLFRDHYNIPLVHVDPPKLQRWRIEWGVGNSIVSYRFC